MPAPRGSGGMPGPQQVAAAATSRLKYLIYLCLLLGAGYLMAPADLLPYTEAPGQLLLQPTITTALPKGDGITTTLLLPTTRLPTDGDDDSANPGIVTTVLPSVVASPVVQVDPASSKYSQSKDRMLLPLLLTHICYHGTSLLATTIKGWILHLLIPQGNIDLVLYYTKPQDREQIVKLLSLTPTAANSFLEDLPTIHEVPAQIFEDGDFQPLSIPLDQLRTENVTFRCGGGEENEKKYGWWNKWKNERGDVQKDGGEPEWFVTPHSPDVKIRLQLTKLSFPPYIHSDPLLLKNESWMRCGCPPFCPAKRAGIDYVQGTRWYTYDLMRQPLMRQYKYWMKLDVDIWFYRPLKFNFVQEMIDAQQKMMVKKQKELRDGQGQVDAGGEEGEVAARTDLELSSLSLPVPVFMHTGKKYNGAGCSTNLHKALLDYARDKNITIVSKDRAWWRSDDDTYYSNFVVSQTEFHMSRRYLELAKYLNNYPRGFFKHRWTDQSLFHKVYGVFFGPNEEDFVLNRSELRCVKKGNALPNAVFWHSKRHWPKKELKKCM